MEVIMSSGAASIMIVVFAAFTLSTDRTIKMIGLGMAAAIAIDALIVRTVLVPAIMHTLGDANWKLPAFIDRTPPSLRIDGDDPSSVTGAPSEVGVGDPEDWVSPTSGGT